MSILETSTGYSIDSSYIMIEIHYRNHNIAFIAIAIMIKITLHVVS